MVRCLATAVILSGVTAVAAAAQQTIGVSAVILERIEPVSADVEVRSAGAGLSVREAAVGTASTRLLRSTFVGVGGDGGAAVLPERLREGGAVRLERTRGSDPERVEREVTVGRTDALLITRVVASNS